MTILQFSAYDYTLSVLTFVISMLIGMYFGCLKNRQLTTNEYLLGNRQMKVLPTSLSLIASHTSVVAIFGIPSDVYLFGSTYVLSVLSSIITTVITIYIFLPVLFNLRAISMYEYLEKRFDTKTRMLGSFLFALNIVLLLPPSTYITALILRAATGLHINLMIWITSGICTFYTAIGGFKTVIWTDVFQFFILSAGFITLLVSGLVSVGGFQEVWSKASESGRVDISFNPDPTIRDTFWSIVIGFTVTNISIAGVNQVCLQKLLAVPTLKDSIKSIKQFTVGLVVSRTLIVLMGLVMYAKYSDCDPFQSKKIERRDQIMLHFLNDVSKDIPGLTGMFVAGVLSACLSTLSAYLNCAAGCVYKDFLGKFLEKKVLEITARNILMALVTVLGVLSGFISLIMRNFENMFTLCLSIMSFTFAPKLAMFTLGAFFPRANAKGAFYGSIIGLIVTLCITIPGKYYQYIGVLKPSFKPLSVENCTLQNATDVFTNVSSIFANYLLNETTRNSTPQDISLQLPFIFRLSFYYDPLIGTLSCVIIGLIISYLTNKNDPPVEETLISSARYSLLPKKNTNIQNDIC